MDRWNIDAGELRQSVTVQEKSVTATDTRGHPTGNWADTVTTRAKIETPTGKKLEYARQLVPDATHQVEMRYRVLDPEKNRLAYFGIKVTTLTGAANTTANTVTVSSASTLRVGQSVLVDSEQMLITAVSNSTLTVSRGVNGTNAANHANAASVLGRRILNIGFINDVDEMHVKLILTCSERKGALTQ